jgi:hypothetical protein
MLYNYSSILLEIICTYQKLVVLLKYESTKLRVISDDPLEEKKHPTRNKLGSCIAIGKKSNQDLKLYCHKYIIN